MSCSCRFPLLGSAFHSKDSTMNNKELSKDLRDKDVEKHRSGDRYKNISKALNILWSTIKTTIKKWKAYGTTKTLPRSDHPSKLNDQARRRLIIQLPLRPYSMQSVGAAEAVSLAIGHNPGWVTTLMQDTQMAQSSKQAGTHIADLRRMTGGVNPT